MIRTQKTMIVFLSILLLNSCLFFDEGPSEQLLSQDISDCLPSFTDNTFEIVSWNIERFPNSEKAPGLLKEIIGQMEIDLLAIQEINRINEFKELLAHFPELGLYLPKTTDLNIGYVYNKNIMEIISNEILFEQDKYLFPRPVVHIEVKSIFDEETWHFFNLHLKCCGGKENRERRTRALDVLKKHLDENYPDEFLMVIGDFNENVPTSETGSLFNFASDFNDYFLTDTFIGMDSQAEWSYPSYPGHLDHILISNEFKEYFIEYQTITLDYCIDNYKELLSDHRPVYAQFKF